MRLADAIDIYVDRKRVAGFAFTTQSGRLLAFGRYIGDVELSAVKTENVLEFLNLRANCNRTHRSKWELLQRFLEYWHVRDRIAAIEMPLKRPKANQDFAAYVYSRAQLKELFDTANGTRRCSHRGVDGETLRMVFLLLYATGARLREVISLRSMDVAIEEASLSFRALGICSERTIPIGRTLSQELLRYVAWKGAPLLPGENLFSSANGNPLKANSVFHNFEKLLRQKSITRRDGATHPPRISDLRVTFAVHRITTWIEEGANLGRLLPALSAYLGQKNLSGTQRFLLLTPERFKKELDKLSPGRGNWSGDDNLLVYLEKL